MKMLLLFWCFPQNVVLQHGAMLLLLLYPGITLCMRGTTQGHVLHAAMRPACCFPQIQQSCVSHGVAGEGPLRLQLRASGC